MTETDTITRAGHVSPTANWIVGQDAEGAQDYIMHTRYPAFLAKLGHDPEEGALSGRVYASRDLHSMTFRTSRLDGALSGLVYATRDERVFYDFIWFDSVPDKTNLLALMTEAERAVEAYRNDL